MCALIKYSAAISGASGKSGGIIFARNKTGAYIRNWVNPVNPNTQRQQDVRADFAFLVSSWKSLSPADQQAWEDMAPQYPYVNRLGEASEYTGQQLYIHLNMNLSVVGATLLDRPLVPQTFTNIGLTALNMTVALGVLDPGTVDTTVACAATESIILEMTNTVSSGITKPAKGLFKQMQIFGSTDGNELDFAAAFTALFGVPEVGAKVFARLWLINENTGQRVNLGQLQTVVV